MIEHHIQIMAGILFLVSFHPFKKITTKSAVNEKSIPLVLKVIKCPINPP